MADAVKLTPEQAAALAAGLSIAQGVAAGSGNPTAVTAVATGVSIINSVLAVAAAGGEYTQADFDAALAADDAAIADDKLAQADAAAKP